jgi:hypothetical protein
MRTATSSLLAALAALATAGSVQAALPLSQRIAPFQPINPNFQIAPGLTARQYAYNTAIIGQALAQVPPYAYGYNPYSYSTITPGSFLGGYNVGSYSPYASAYSPYGVNPYLSTGYSSPGATGGYGGGYGSGGGYGNPYVSSADPYSGSLRGTVDLTTASGKYLAQTQEARLTQNKADEGKLSLRRKIWDEAEWERKHTPTAEDVRLHEMRYGLARALANPPANEIWSGKALNDIFDNLRDRADTTRGPNVPLDEDLLKKINVTAGTGGNIGLLKNDGNLHWPIELQDRDFAAEREELNKLFAEAVRQIKFNDAAGTATLKGLIANQKRLHEKLNRKSARDMTPTESIRARRYLDEIDEAIKALQDPNVGNFFKQTWAVKGKNVAAVVRYMTEKGIKFAPATSGTEDAYRALHSALVAYYSSMSQATATAPR